MKENTKVLCKYSWFFSKLEWTSNEEAVIKGSKPYS